MKKNTETREFVRPLPVNRLNPQKNEEIVGKNEINLVKPCLFYESCVVKLLKSDEIIEKDVELTGEFPIDPLEIQSDVAFDTALNKNFVAVPKQATKIQPAKKKPVKNTENFVRTTMNRSKSSKKMGKTGCPKRKFRYFTPNQASGAEIDKILYSSGYNVKKRTSFTSLPDILLHEFHFSSWRPGQLESIQSILSKKNTLTILPTGTGKSLIYQMCSRLLGGLCIVISPLLSLINDQLMRLPECLSASALYSNISYAQYHNILQKARNGEFDIIFVTPEKFISENIGSLPNISLICIDEAHCISKYSKSTRISYMLLPNLLAGHCTLSLTAAADKITLADLEDLLKTECTVQDGKAFRANLNVTVSRESDIITAAGKIMNCERFKSGSVIVYCAIRYIADSVAQWLRSKGESCMSYHGALEDNKRTKVQEDFITGRIRIIVATIAFGMGIDKADIKGVVHLHMPYSLEHFIQESGRAGRNGSEANVHVFISEASLYFQRALIYSSHVTKKQIIKLVKILSPSTLKRSRDSATPQGPLLHLKIDETCEDMCLDKERILCILYHLQSKSVISSVAVHPITLTIGFHKTSPDQLAEKFSIISHILTTGKKLSNGRKISLLELTEKVQISLHETIKVLKRLSATGEISAEFADEAFVITSGKLPQELKLLQFASETEKYFSDIEETFRKKIETCFMVLDRVAKDSMKDCKNCNEELSGLVEEYLHEGFYDEIPEDDLGDIDVDIQSVALEIEGIPEAKDIACILQGINSNRTPMERWKKYHMWGRYKKFRFLQVYQECCQVLLEDLGKKVTFKQNALEIIEHN